MSPNVAASIKARLLNQARSRDEPFEPLLVRYAQERFLHRLGASSLRKLCILKGAGLLTIWLPDPYRMTHDVDLLATGPSDAATVREHMRSICAMPCPEDGLVFDLDDLSITAIRAEQKYAGQRAVVRAYLGKARIRVQVDFGFGDALSVPAEDAVLPTLLDRLPAPRVRAYPRVASVAEKFEAMVHLGRRNSRMKDFHDLWALSSELPFEGMALRNAIAACFERRGTSWTAAVPDVLTSAFFTDPDVQARWRAYLERKQFRAAPPARMMDVGDRIRAFLGPVRQSILVGDGFDRYWPPGGPWTHRRSSEASVG